MLIAHRGFRKGNKENRMADFKNALNFCKGVEFDIRLTKDKKVIIFHDDDFKRIGNCNKKVRKLTYQEIKNLDFFKKNPDYLPPLFVEEFGQQLSDKFELINVEIKQDKYSKSDFEIIKESIFKLKSMTKAEIIISSFGLKELKFISNLEKGFKKGYLFKRIIFINKWRLKKFDYLHAPIYILLNKNKTKKIRSLKKPINAWTFLNNKQVFELKQIYSDSEIVSYISDNPNLDLN
ncbi:glycerophosphoryl diester phosphodiesterase [Spiroplasma chinense]|uniref:Glycerophosphoryl diester phosphodiesterase n=1 Tax=Spiroplasma chinense TaxID=216932 RepID=A0A5B9Y2T5_9MOLU|nr:glycerophosphodiester phosphodiesterase family protein [Spiroplasma chinense]QEH61358.1 glycerophosphoryl diester phosphodiesterase [Spiroplasma chinense]